VVVVHHPKPSPTIVVHPKHSPPPPRVIAVKSPQEPWVQVTINSREREVIREYVVHKNGNGKHGHGHGKSHDDDDDGGSVKQKGKQKALPKGVARKVERGGNLPPGWQNKCVRGRIMPVEVYRHCEPLPREVAVKLPAPPAGTIIVTIEGKAVRLMQATREILDVFDVI
jgi:hypothetical protein